MLVAPQVLVPLFQHTVALEEGLVMVVVAVGNLQREVLALGV